MKVSTIASALVGIAAAWGCASKSPLSAGDRATRGSLGVAESSKEVAERSGAGSESVGPAHSKPGDSEDVGGLASPQLGPVEADWASRATAQLVLAAGNLGGPHVSVRSGADLSRDASFLAFDPDFRGGARVAMALGNEGKRYLAVGAGAGGGPHVRVFVDGVLLFDELVYESGFRGGVYVALGDLDGDGVPELVTGPGGGGGSRVRAFDLATGAERANFLAFDEDFRGGARVAACDLNGDRISDVVVVPGPGGGPLVRAFDGRSQGRVANFFAWPEERERFRGGLHVACGRFAGKPGIVVSAGTPGEESTAAYVGAGDPGSSRVTILRVDGTSIGNYFAFPSGERFGARVATLDVQGDGESDVVVCAGHGGSGHVRIFQGTSDREILPGFIAFPADFRGGCFVAGI